jgi:hypothetical protein
MEFWGFIMTWSLYGGLLSCFSFALLRADWTMGRFIFNLEVFLWKYLVHKQKIEFSRATPHWPLAPLTLACIGKCSRIQGTKMPPQTCSGLTHHPADLGPSPKGLWRHGVFWEEILKKRAKWENTGHVRCGDSPWKGDITFICTSPAGQVNAHIH